MTRFTHYIAYVDGGRRGEEGGTLGKNVSEFSYLFGQFGHNAKLAKNQIFYQNQCPVNLEI